MAAPRDEDVKFHPGRCDYCGDLPDRDRQQLVTDRGHTIMVCGNCAERFPDAIVNMPAGPR